MDEKSSAPAAIPPPQPVPSMDDQLKEAQKKKLERETELLGKPPSRIENVNKLALPLIALLAALAAFAIGLPQKMYELAKAQRELAQLEQELTQKKKTASDLELKRDKLLADMDVARKDAEAATKLAAEERGAVESARQELRKIQDDTAAAKQQKSPVIALAVAQELVKPRVFVQFAGELSRGRIDELRTKLAGAGFVAPPAERINRGQKNEVRYFVDSDAERILATKARDQTLAFFNAAGCPLPSLEVKQVRNSKPSPLEVWLTHNCK